MQWVNTIAQGILLGGLYALYGTGLSLIFGVMRLVNLAHGDFVVISAYLALVAVQILGLSPLLSLLLVAPLLFGLGFLLQQRIL
ncbi:MAG: branched-chain amino acid ABC transporter permease, partial [Chloroflexi bacterium]|nr:branched-chain amino acid ABC transporter permease [Chloroflexota bacterium]